jgi:hypothetical protein
MIVVTGSEPAVVSAVVAAAGDRGVRAHAWAFRPDDSESDVVAHMRELDASVLVVIEPLRWLDGRHPTRTDSALLEEALRAARSAHGARIVLVTARRPDDPGVERIRRAGVGYVVLRPAPLAAPAWAKRLRERPVFVPASLRPPPAGVCALHELAEAVADAAIEWETPGRIIEVGCFTPEAWLELIRAAGGQPRVAPAWRIAWARIVGDTVLEPPEEKDPCPPMSTRAATAATNSSWNSA